MDTRAIRMGNTMEGGEGDFASQWGLNPEADAIAEAEREAKYEAIRERNRIIIAEINAERQARQAAQAH